MRSCYEKHVISKNQFSGIVFFVSNDPDKLGNMCKF